MVRFSTVWPLGLSWSSAVAQETLLSFAKCSGLDSSMVLANDVPLPTDLTVTCAVSRVLLKIMSELKLDKAIGPDGLPVQIFRECRAVPAVAVAMLVRFV